MRAIVHVLALGLSIAMFAFAIATYDELPGEFPTHFNAAGEADAIAAKSWAAWLTPPILGVAMIAFVYGCAWLVHWMILSKPELVNLPHKAKIVAMTPDQRLPIARAMSLMLCGMAVPIGGLMLYLQAETLRVAKDRTLTMSDWAFWLVMGVLLVMVVGGMVIAVRRVREVVEGDRANP